MKSTDDKDALTLAETVKRVFSTLAAHSLRGIYLLATGFLALIIVAAVPTTEPLDSPPSPPGYAHSTAKGDLRALRNAIWDAEDALERLLLIANTESQETSYHRIHQARLRVGQLQEYDWIRTNPDSLEAVHALSADLERLMIRTKAAVQLPRSNHPHAVPISRWDSSTQARRATQVQSATYDRMIALYGSSPEHNELKLLRDAVQPLFVRIWRRIRVLENDFDVLATEDTAAVQSANKYGRSGNLWSLVLFGLVATGVGFVLSEYSGRRPLAGDVPNVTPPISGYDLDSRSSGRVQEKNPITALRERHTRQHRLELILDHAPQAIITFNSTGVIDSINQAAAKLFGYREDKMMGERVSLLIAPPNTWNGKKDYLAYFLSTELERFISAEGEVVGRRNGGATFPMAIRLSAPTLDGEPLYTALLSDISEHKAMLDNLTAMAEHDGLTGLYNRTYFQQELDRVVDRARRTGRRYSLLYIDLDNFKFVNDTLGHAAGDRLLGEISKELLKRARKSDLVARFGGDEFTVLLYDIDPKLSVEVAESFHKKVSDYVFVHGGEAIQVGCSIGAVVIGAESTSAEEALSRADLSCHLAKRSGRNRIHLFNPADHADVATMTADMGWSRRIKHAIDNGRFALACQPIVSTQDRTLESFEVLIRMLDEDESLIMPEGFLATAERFGLANDIDRWVIVHSIDNLIEQRRTAPNTRYSINLSAQTLSDPSICDFIVEKLETSGLHPTALTFEITETAAIANMYVATKLLSRLQRIGCKIALDDFGSGMPSFAYLKDLPVDIVKIDGHFVKQLAESPVDQAIVKGMNDIVHALGKKTVAEFVENEESFRLLAAYGVDYAQGYYLGRPELKGLCATASAEQKSN